MQTLIYPENIYVYYSLGGVFLAHNQLVPMWRIFTPITELRYRFGGCRGKNRHRKHFWIEERWFRNLVNNTLKEG